MNKKEGIGYVYRELRRAGYRPPQALASAKTVVDFREMEKRDLVRIRAEEEREKYFDVFGDPMGYTDNKGRKISAEEEEKEIIRSIETLGCWVVIAEYFDGEEWQHAESVGMCTGYNRPCSPIENCYVSDLMRSALDCLARFWEEPSGDNADTLETFSR